MKEQRVTFSASVIVKPLVLKSICSKLMKAPREITLAEVSEAGLAKDMLSPQFYQMSSNACHILPNT
eukprot:963243-Pyramimonas_sp.AAC.1